MNIRPASRKRVVVVGGGCGGLQVARSLRGQPVDLTVIDRRQGHVLHPLLYQVARGRLATEDAAPSILRILQHAENARCLTAEVTHVDLARREVQLATGPRLPYDYLVLAAGSEPAYAEPSQAWRELAPALEDVEAASRIHQRLLGAAGRAPGGSDGERAGHEPRCVVVGAGPTGVELAAALAGWPRRGAASAPATRVTLLEQAHRVLPGHHHRSTDYAHAVLEGAGVEIRTSTRALGVEPGAVLCADGRIEADVACWAGGIRPAGLAFGLDAEHDEHGRVVVGGDCSLSRHPEVFVIGDMARPMRHLRDVPLPALATVAIQQGRAVAANIVRDLQHVPRHAFALQPAPCFTAVGDGRAVAQVGDLHLHGRGAWALRSLVHSIRIVGLPRQAQLLVRVLRRRWIAADDRPVDPTLPRRDALPRLPRDTQHTGAGA